MLTFSRISDQTRYPAVYRISGQFSIRCNPNQSMGIVYVIGAPRVYVTINSFKRNKTDVKITFWDTIIIEIIAGYDLKKAFA